MSEYNGAGLGWEFDIELDDTTGAPSGGVLLLKNIRHGGHNFARNTVAIGACVKFEQVDSSGKVLKTKKEFLPFDSSAFQVTALKTLAPKPVTVIRRSSPAHGSPYRGGVFVQQQTFDYLSQADPNSILQFSDYFQDPSGNYVAYGVTSTYDAPKALADLSFGNCEYAGISIDQTFLFSRYSADPPHEPSGALMAARFHPLVTYRCSINDSCDLGKVRTRIASIRFDFRLYLYIDTHLSDDPMSAHVQKNQAGLFADADAGNVRSGVRYVFRSTARTAFFAVEKPLVYEVIAPGLIHGEPSGRPAGQYNEVTCWDNVHWWGADDPNKGMPSTPGAFHAAHVHWRWGEVLSNITSRMAASAWRRFQPGTPLLDPGIPRQTLLAAVTKYRQVQDPTKAALRRLSTNDWQDLFLKVTPERIKDGDQLVLWYSSEVHDVEIAAPLRMPRNGTVFVHGIFFAHNPERAGAGIGDRRAMYWPRDESDVKGWFRPASD
jgi:hypothetical protein